MRLRDFDSVVLLNCYMFSNEREQGSPIAIASNCSFKSISLEMKVAAYDWELLKDF